MMYVASYSYGHTLPRPGGASRVLRRAATFTPSRDNVVYWLAAIADFGLARAQLLPQGVPVLAYVTYRLSVAFRPAKLVADREIGAASLPPNTAAAREQPCLIQTQGQDRNYLSAQQQTIYEQLVAGSTLAQECQAPVPNLVPLPLADITRELAGWSSPQAGASGRRAPHAAPTHGNRAHSKSRHDQCATSN